MQRLHDSVPDRSHRIAEAPRCPTLYFLSYHREPLVDPCGVPQGNREPDLRLR